MGQKLAHYEIKNQIAIVTIDHSPMNALDVVTKEAIGEVFAELDARRQEIRAVILHGAGEKAFAAGADIKAFLELTPDIAKRRLSRSHQIYGMVENFEWPVIAAIHGFCLGGGLELALCCDIRVAADTAIMGVPEINLGIIPGYGGTQRLPRLVGMGMAKKLVLTGEHISAQEAYRIGLVDVLVPPSELDDATAKLCRRIASKSPIALAMGKEAINRGMQADLRTGLSIEARCFCLCFGSEDRQEGMKAFLEKRKPDFKGR